MRRAPSRAPCTCAPMRPSSFISHARACPGRCGGSNRAAGSLCRSALNGLNARQGAVVAALNTSSLHSRPLSGVAPNRRCRKRFYNFFLNRFFVCKTNTAVWPLNSLIPWKRRETEQYPIKTNGCRVGVRCNTSVSSGAGRANPPDPHNANDRRPNSGLGRRPVLRHNY